MKVIELAKALGEGIAEDPTLIAYDEAKAAFEADKLLTEQMTEYNTHRTCLAAEFNKDLAMQDKDVIESLKAKMDELKLKGKMIIEYPNKYPITPKNKIISVLIDISFISNNFKLYKNRIENHKHENIPIGD